MDDEENKQQQNQLVETYTVGGVDHPAKLVDDLFIDRTDLSFAFEVHSERFSWYATAYELALDAEQRIKAQLDRAYAQLDVQARTNMEAAGVKVTEKKVENTVITHPQYIKLQNDYFDAKREAGLLKAAKDAMVHRKDCLVSLGANVRQEMQSNPSLLEEAYKNKFRTA